MADIQTKVCITCKLEKSIDEFYNSKISKDGHVNDCKECNKSKKKRNNENKDLAFRVPMEVGKYTNLKQKEKTFEFLKSIGWQYYEKTGIWWKLPKKNKYGIWSLPKWKPPKVPYVVNGVERKCRKHTNTIIKERKKTLKKPENYKPVKKTNRSLTDEQFEEIRKKYKLNGVTMMMLAFEYGKSQSYIRKVIFYQV